MEITKKLKEIILSDNTGFIMGTHNGILMKIVKESRLKKSINCKKTLLSYRENYDEGGYDLYNLIEKKENWLINKKILDLGYGVGKKAELYEKNNAKEVIGIDLSKREIKVAKKFEKQNLKYLNISSSELVKTHSNYFDTIVSFTVFEHIEKDLLLNVLIDCYNLLKNNGILLIIYNHYLDRFGSYLVDFIYFSHPTLIFKEDFVFDYCNKKLRKFHKNRELEYFPENYTFSDNHNSDCYMALNKLKTKEFIEVIKKSKFNNFKYIPYSQTTIMKIMNKLFPKAEIFKGSYLYSLIKELT